MDKAHMDPKKLDAVKNERFIYLTTTGRVTGKLHAVELWFAAADGKVYLSHEGKDTDWMKNLYRSDEVSFKIGGSKFEARANLVKSGAGRERGKIALYEKYYGQAKKETIDDWFSLSKVIELTPA